MNPSVSCLLAGLLTAPALHAAADSPPTPFADVPFPVIERFENFGRADGIPDEKVHAVYKTRDGRLWIGTWNGLCVRGEDGRFHRYGPEDGLSHKMVLQIVEDPQTGDLWIATMRGLTRYSGGRFTVYTQTNSGLPNNVVYGVDVGGGRIWVATAAGAGCLDPRTGEWKIYDHNNTVMHEPWCYAIKATPELVFIGVWGGGIIEHDPARGTFKEYRDPDRDFHFDLVPDDGPVNDITAWIAWEDGRLWQCTYFGFARRDARGWKTWVEEKTPLLSNFTQFVWAHRGTAWIGMDKGVSVTDGETWVNYEVGAKGEGLRTLHRPGQPPKTQPMSTALANGFVLGIYVDDDEAWFATSLGLSRGVFAGPPRPAAVARAQR